MPTQAEIAQRKAELQKTIAPPYTVAGSTLSPIEKEFQRMTLARDWDSLFAFLPAPEWGQYGILGKYSFRDEGGKRIYVPFSKEEISRFVFSPYYTVQPNWTCTDEQRQMGVEALFKAGQTHSAKFPVTDWRSIWPIYPGWGYPGQRYGCEKYQPSTWVKIRKPVVAAAAIVSAVYLGPAVLGKIKALSGAGAGATGTGSKVLAGSQKLVGTVNKVNTVKAIAKGELPPPPISVSGASWREWAFIVAKDEVQQEAKNAAMAAGQKYIEKKLTAKEEAAMRAEIAAMQKELEAITPKNIPISPAVDLSPTIKKFQTVEENREVDLQKLLIPAALIAGALLLGA